MYFSTFQLNSLYLLQRIDYQMIRYSVESGIRIKKLRKVLIAAQLALALFKKYLFSASETEVWRT